MCRRLGLDPVEVVRVEVGTRGGPEAAARNARRAAFESARERLGAAAILVGHTLDDQAETVILGLARGSGARSLSGMARESRDGYLRPFLGLERANTRKACAALGLEPWEDPHNEDRTYARVRVRLDGLPSLEGALGPGVANALARSADLLRADADALDDWANLAAKDVAHRDGGYDCFALGQLPRAVRTRIIRRAAITAGAPAASLSHGHIGAIDALVTGWRGQGPVALPGRVRAWRRYGRLLLAPEEADHQQGDLDEAEDGSQRPSPKE